MRALDLLDDPARLYAEGNETVRAILNKAFFARLYVHGRLVTYELREPFDVLEGAYDIYRQRRDSKRRSGGSDQPRTYHRVNGSLALADELKEIDVPDELPGWLTSSQTAHSAVLLTESGAVIDPRIPALAREEASRTLSLVLQGQGWSRDAMVDLTGTLSHQHREVQRLLDLAASWPVRSRGRLAPPGRPVRTIRRLEQGELDELVAAYRDGATVYELARRFGISRQTVGKHLRAGGVDTTPPALRPEDVPTAAGLYRQGWSLAKIAQRYGTTHTSVRNRLLGVGVRMRKPREQ